MLVEYKPECPHCCGKDTGTLSYKVTDAIKGLEVREGVVGYEKDTYIRDGWLILRVYCPECGTLFHPGTLGIQQSELAR